MKIFTLKNTISAFKVYSFDRVKVTERTEPTHLEKDQQKFDLNKYTHTQWYKQITKHQKLVRRYKKMFHLLQKERKGINLENIFDKMVENLSKFGERKKN